jgi:pyruvate/2-oxoglutarate dehydrogenase complex dihydrolipoamide acyltransferase (E2) component
VSVNDFVMRAAALALRDVPEANAAWDAAAGGAVLQPSVDVCVAVATEGGLITPIVKGADRKSLLQVGCRWRARAGGALVARRSHRCRAHAPQPATAPRCCLLLCHATRNTTHTHTHTRTHDAQQISGEVKDLAARARANKLKPEEFMGGSFSISNLGMYGLNEFAAIINPPQAAILAVGGAQKRVVAREGAGRSGLASASFMTVTLSADHRVFDGELATRLLDAFRRYMENPVAMAA